MHNNNRSEIDETVNKTVTNTDGTKSNTSSTHDRPNNNSKSSRNITLMVMFDCVLSTLGMIYYFVHILYVMNIYIYLFLLKV
jgi:hypothetical protein